MPRSGKSAARKEYIIVSVRSSKTFAALAATAAVAAPTALVTPAAVAKKIYPTPPTISTGGKPVGGNSTTKGLCNEAAQVLSGKSLKGIKGFKVPLPSGATPGTYTEQLLGNGKALGKGSTTITSVATVRVTAAKSGKSSITVKLSKAGKKFLKSHTKAKLSLKATQVAGGKSTTSTLKLKLS